MELTAENLAVSKIAVSSDQLEEMTQTSWHLEIHDETCYRNPNTGWLTGTGTFLTLELVNARPTDYSFLPDGTYTVDGEPTTDPDTGLQQYRIPAVAAGKYTRPGFYGASSFVRYEEGTETEGTGIYGGTVTVSREGDVYTLVFDLKDDAENTISGTYTGTITEYVVQ